MTQCRPIPSRRKPERLPVPSPTSLHPPILIWAHWPLAALMTMGATRPGLQMQDLHGRGPQMLHRRRSTPQTQGLRTLHREETPEIHPVLVARVHRALQATGRVHRALRVLVRAHQAASQVVTIFLSRSGLTVGFPMDQVVETMMETIMPMT